MRSSLLCGQPCELLDLGAGPVEGGLDVARLSPVLGRGFQPLPGALDSAVIHGRNVP